MFDIIMIVQSSLFVRGSCDFENESWERFSKFFKGQKGRFSKFWVWAYRDKKELIAENQLVGSFKVPRAGILTIW